MDIDASFSSTLALKAYCFGLLITKQYIRDGFLRRLVSECRLYSIGKR